MKRAHLAALASLEDADSHNGPDWLRGPSAACAVQFADRLETCSVATSDGIRSPYRPVVRRYRRPAADGARSCAGRRASPFFSQDILQHRLVQREIRHHPLQLRVLVFKLFEAADLGDAHTGVNFLPAVKSRLRYPHLATNLLDRRADVSLPQRKGSLLL